MSHRTIYNILTIVVTYLLKFIVSYNLDTDSPLIYESLSIDDYFGYSVSLYAGNLDTAWIEISAPKGYNTSYEFNKSGGVYRCEILGPCNLRNIKLDSSEANNGMYYEWLGVALDVNDRNGNDIICSHKWLTKYYALPGECFTSVETNSSYTTLIPLQNEYSEVISSDNSWYHFHKYSQSGIAVHFVNQDQNVNEILIGAPGTFNWFGTVILYNKHHLNIVIDPRDFADYFSDAQTRTTFFNYLGYSISSGYYFGRRYLYYVAGAPRFAGIGRVILFQIRPDKSLYHLSVIDGKQFGEYFGASITSGDLNNDGFDDLIIGAPYYTSDTYNEGRVDIYFGNGRYLYPPTNGKSIYGKAPGGQFGNTITFLKDIDGDGFPEVAISAPSENDGTGVVYLYRSTINGLDIEPSQILIGKYFNPQIKGFGISISKSMDVDGNNYRDVAIGAYKSSQTFLFRSKSTVILKHNLTSIINLIDIERKEFYVKYCLRYEGLNLPSQINVTRKIIVDELYYRAYLARDHSTDEIVTLTNGITCKEVKIILKENIQFDDPINIKLSQNLIEASNNHKRSTLITISNKRKQSDTFCKECIAYDKYRSTKTVSIDVPFSLKCGNKQCQSQLEIYQYFPDLPTDGFVLGSKQNVQFVLRVKNIGERAIFTRLSIELPHGVTYSNIPSDCEELKTGEILCLIANVLQQNEERTVSINLNMKAINMENTNQTSLTFNVTALTSSANLNQPSKIINLPVKMEADITVTGNSAEQSYNFKDVNETKFLQTFQVQKFGVSSLQLVKLQIKLPTRLRNDDKILVNYDSIIGTQSNRRIDCNIETNNMQSSDAMGKKPDMMSNEYDSYDPHRIYNLNCANDEVFCTLITCRIGPFINHGDEANLNLYISLNASNFANFLKNEDSIIVTTDASVTIESPKNFIQYEERPDYVQVQSFFVKHPSGVSLVLIVLPSIVLGVLLLALLVYVLYKKGFFKRQKMEELKTMKLNEENLNEAEIKLNES